MDAEGGASFAELTARYADRDGLNRYKLSLAIGLLPGNIGYSAGQVGRLLEGKQRPQTAGLVERLIEVFHLEGTEADRYRFAAGLIPADWDFATFQQAAEAHRRQAHDRARRRGDREVRHDDDDPDDHAEPNGHAA